VRFATRMRGDLTRPCAALRTEHGRPPTIPSVLMRHDLAGLASNRPKLRIRRRSESGSLRRRVSSGLPAEARPMILLDLGGFAEAGPRRIAGRAGRTLVRCVLRSGSSLGLPIPAWAGTTTKPWWSGSASQPQTARRPRLRWPWWLRRSGSAAARSLWWQGARSRVKILDVPGADPATLERLLAL
jgi:hypothetical protein